MTIKKINNSGKSNNLKPSKSDSKKSKNPGSSKLQDIFTPENGRTNIAASSRVLNPFSMDKGARLPTGIKAFDDIVEGGFKTGTTNLIAGGAGSGKTIFAIEFLYNGAVKYNENSLYITFEEKKLSIYSDMKRFGWDLEKLEKEGKFFFLEYTPEQVKKVLIEGGGFVESIIQKNKIKRIVIDSISSFSLLYQDELTRKEAALALIDLISRWDCTALLTSQDETQDGLFVTAALEFEVDSIILIYNVKQKGERIRAMEILKMRGTKHTNKTFKLEITEKGFELFPTKKVVF